MRLPISTNAHGKKVWCYLTHTSIYITRIYTHTHTYIHTHTTCMILCTSKLEDLDYAQRVCEQLEVPLETLSLQKEYWNQVVQYTLKEAEEGRTPNPDIMCNSRIKFGMFYEYIGRYGIDAIYMPCFKRSSFCDVGNDTLFLFCTLFYVVCACAIQLSFEDSHGALCTD